MIHYSFITGLNDLGEGWFKRCTTNKETINIWLGDKLITVLVSDGSSVDNSDGRRSLFGDLSGKEFSDMEMDFLSLLWSGSFSGSDSPNWFIGNNNIVPLFSSQVKGDQGLKLTFNNLRSMSSFSLFQFLTNTEDYLKSLRKCQNSFLGNKFFALIIDSSSLRMSQDNPIKTQILDMVSRNFSSVGTVLIL